MEIVKFSIKSSQDYGSYSTGESLNSIFKFGYDLDADSYHIYEFQTDYYYIATSYFSLTISPSSEAEHIFTFHISLDDGREFTLMMNPIMIVP